MEIGDIPKELRQISHRKELGQSVTLTGPYSPLKANHSSCHYATKMRRVQLANDSINSAGLEEETMKTGVLCGLGFHPVSNTSLYPDHDMDKAFDVNISTEDLVRVRSSIHFFDLFASTSLDQWNS